MGNAAWYLFPAGAVVLGVISFCIARFEQVMFDRRYPDEAEARAIPAPPHHNHA